MSNPKTKWAVICRSHGQVFMDFQEYLRQLGLPDNLWVCPVCKQPAWFDDDNYEDSVVTDER